MGKTIREVIVDYDFKNQVVEGTQDRLGWAGDEQSVYD